MIHPILYLLVVFRLPFSMVMIAIYYYIMIMDLLYHFIDYFAMWHPLPSEVWKRHILQRLYVCPL